MKTKTITPEQLNKFTLDDNGNYILPEGMELYIKDDTKKLKEDRIKLLEDELKKMKKPTDEELIQEGKMNHPFHLMEDELNQLKIKK